MPRAKKPKHSRNITKRYLINEISDELGKYVSVEQIAKILDSLERVCIFQLKQAVQGKPVVIRLMDGLYLQSELLPEAEIPGFGGKPCIRSQRLRATARFTRYFNRYSLNDLGC